MNCATQPLARQFLGLGHQKRNRHMTCLRMSVLILLVHLSQLIQDELVARTPCSFAVLKAHNC